MSLYQKASLVQIPSGYKAADDKLYSVVPNNGDGDFTVTVAAGATRVNKDGLIESVVADQARLNYDPTNPQDPHLLLEPSRTNSIIQSEDLGTSWSTFNGGSISTNESTSPDGSLTADKLSTNGTSFSFVKPSTNPTISTGNNTFTIFAKADTSDELWLRLDYGTTIYNRKFNLTTQTISTGFDNTGNIPDEETIEDYGNGWYRLRITDSADTTSFDPRIYVADATSTSGDSVFLWGAQVEAGSYPTSYIPTTTGAVTRTADSCEIASGIENLIGQTEGTLFLDFEYLYETTTDSSTDANRDIFVLGTASDVSEGISIDNYRSQFRVFVQGSGMSTQFIGNSTIGAAQPNTRYKLAVKYKTGDCKAYLNGTLLGSGTGTVSFAADLDGIFFSYNSGSRPFKNQKKVYQLMVFNEALSDSELQTLTS
jgi:hypothetical protein